MPRNCVAYVRRTYIENKANIHYSLSCRYVNLMIKIKRQPNRTRLVYSALWVTPTLHRVLVVTVPVKPQTSFVTRPRPLQSTSAEESISCLSSARRGREGGSTEWAAWLNSSFFLNGRHYKHGSINAHSCAVSFLRLCSHVGHRATFLATFCQGLKAQ